jgi:SAM-dependent methyltransferase
MRPWENWDKEGVAARIHRIWMNDPTGYEGLHREILAKLLQEYLISHNSSVLEAGCGTGLVYRALVPAVISNEQYTGIDISEKMLMIAKRDYPNGRFLRDDLFNLSFRDNSASVVLCFEVLGHLPEIVTPIHEMIRVSERLIIFTVWVSQSGRTEEYGGTIDGHAFLRNHYVHEHIIEAIKAVEGNDTFGIEVRVLTESKWAYVIRKDSKDSYIRFYPFYGTTAKLIARNRRLHNESKDLKKEAAEFNRDLGVCMREIKRLKEKLQKLEAGVLR